jgi:hypothetical protein
LAELIERSAHEPVSPMWLAPIYAALGELDDGIAALERGLSDWGPGYVLILGSPACEAMRSHPHFAEILRSVGYTGPWASPPAAVTPDLSTRLR